MFSYKGLCFRKSDLVIEVSRFDDDSVYYFVTVRHGIVGYDVLFVSKDLQKAFDYYDGILKENGVAREGIE